MTQLGEQRQQEGFPFAHLAIAKQGQHRGGGRVARIYLSRWIDAKDRILSQRASWLASWIGRMDREPILKHGN